MGREAPRVCIHFVRKKGSEYPKSFMHDKIATMTLNLHPFFNLNTMSLTFQILQYTFGILYQLYRDSEWLDN